MVYQLPVIKYRDIVSGVTKKPIFSVKELVNRGIPSNYARLLVHNLTKKGKIFRVEKGYYATVNNPFVVAGLIVFPSYISMYSALYLRGLLSQIAFAIQVVTTKRRKNKKLFFADTPIEFYKIKRDYFFGFEYIMYDGFEIPIAQPEKAIIDIFYFMGGIAGSIDAGEIDYKRLHAYLDYMGIKSLKDRVKRWIKSGATNQ